MDIEANQSVKYSMFNDLKFKGKDKKHVYLEGKDGDVKKVYVELFIKYGEIKG